MKRLHIAIVTNLYPNSIEKTRGLFIKQFAERLAQKVDVTVISPIPWIPAWLQKLTGKGINVPKAEKIGALVVHHPRYLVIPKICRFAYGWFYYLGIRKVLGTLHANKPVDLISAHWIYPDGYGSSLAARDLQLPIILHARGCDINHYTKFYFRRKLIRSALLNSSLNISVSSEIVDKISELGVPRGKTRLVLNGVDQKVFRRQDKLEARRKLSLSPTQKLLLYVGNLQKEKGVNYLIEAVSLSRDVDFTLLIVGDGPEKLNIERQIRHYGIEDKVIIEGRLPHDQIPAYLASADLLCLPSLREGCPNIVLESLSVGTPVLSSRVGAVPDIVNRPEWGILVPPENASALADGIREGLELKDNPIPEFSWYDWDENAEVIYQIFREVLNAPPESLSTGSVSA